MIYNTDFLLDNGKIDNESVDLILTDLPYGIMGMENTNHGMTNNVAWDSAIEPSKVFEVANRILRKNGKMVLFSQEPYTTSLINEAFTSVPFLYRMIWEKDHFANSLSAKKAPVSYFEDILVFGKKNNKLDFRKQNPLREVMSKYVDKYGKDFLVDLFEKEGRYTSKESSKVHSALKFGYNKGCRIDMMTEDLYAYLSDYIEFKESYIELRDIYSAYHQELKNELNIKYPSVFNLWEGNKYKGNVLKYKKDYDGFHPTQKPILLIEDLMKTFSNDNDLVVDLTIGSGTTAIACINCDRRYIGFELDRQYFLVANRRIN